MRRIRRALALARHQIRTVVIPTIAVAAGDDQQGASPGRGDVREEEWTVISGQGPEIGHCITLDPCRTRTYDRQDSASARLRQPGHGQDVGQGTQGLSRSRQGPRATRPDRRRQARLRGRPDADAPRRLPKRGFTNPFKVTAQVASNLRELAARRHRADARDAVRGGADQRHDGSGQAAGQRRGRSRLLGARAQGRRPPGPRSKRPAGRWRRK